jgi:RNA methyltransferase, TrmH family
VGPRRGPAWPPADAVPHERVPGRVHKRELIAVCGLAAVLALFARDPGRVERLFFEPRLAPELAQPRFMLAGMRKPYREVGSDELARIAGTVRHGGVVAIARPRPLPSLDGVARIILADRPEQALPSAASYRVAEGALDLVELYRARLPAALPALQRCYRVVGTALDRGVPLPEFRSNRPIALILGNEEHGVDPAILALCDGVVSIPGSSGRRVQSLNVAAAAAVLLYALTSG